MKTGLNSIQHFSLLVAQLAKNLPAMQVTPVRFLGWEDPLEKGMAPHPSILAWRIPWTVQSLGSQRVGRDWAAFPHSLGVIRLESPHCRVTWYREAAARTQQPFITAKTFTKLQLKRTFFNKMKTINRTKSWVLSLILEEGKDVHSQYS